jgi:hypothetical protein
MPVYAWPVSVLRDIERWIKNFIWSGDTDKRKLVNVSWKKVCFDLDEGGLGIKSLVCLNEASSLKFCWEMLHSEETWAVLVRSRVHRSNSCISYHIFSSLWSGMKHQFQIIKAKTVWLIGDCLKTNFWRDNWSGVVIDDHFQIPITISSLYLQQVK